MKSITRVITLSAALLTPAFASAVYTQQQTTNFSWGIVSSSGGFNGGVLGGCTGTICGVASTILYLINNVAVPLLFAVSFIVFLYGIASAYILHPGDETAVKTGHKLVLWGIIGFAVMISLWGLVNVVSNTFGLSGYYAPPTPTSY